MPCLPTRGLVQVVQPRMLGPAPTPALPASMPFEAKAPERYGLVVWWLSTSTRGTLETGYLMAP
jgi:hypothetical protein